MDNKATPRIEVKKGKKTTFFTGKKAVENRVEAEKKATPVVKKEAK